MDMFNGLNPNAGTFTPASDTSYKERVKYDPNGNILGYLRNGDAGNTMDSLNYKYYASTNQLSQVTDNVLATKYATDIDNEAPNNYTYDAIGNLVGDASDTITYIKWNVYGKIDSIRKNNKGIKYIYDASGNRIMKRTQTDTTVYVRDATGNVLSIYTKPASGSLAQTEIDLYGSSRLGMATKHSASDTSFALGTGWGNMKGIIFTRGEKLFELNNHLGNVLVTISDRRIQVDGNSDGTVDSYKADITSANDYYPFGMQMPGRKYSATTGYRYGFNGKEDDNDVKGEGNQVAFEARIYDPRLGRFLSCDPLERIFPWQSTYVFANNNPIKLIEILGMSGDDPTPVYHRTSSSNAASISQSGFDPGKSNRNGFTYFSTTPEGGGIGTAAASGNTVVNASVDLSNAKSVSKEQMTQWFNEGFKEANKQLNTKYSSISEVPKELQSKYQSIADGVRNTKLADFMKNDGGEIYIIAGKNTVAVSESAISKVKITGLSGSGASEAIQLMSRPALNGESAAALAKYGEAVNMIKWGGRACIAIAVAADIYEIYQSDNKMRTVTTKVGGWAAGLSMGAWGAAAGSETGPGAIITGLVGFGVGYFVGSKTTEIVYDYLFTKGVNSK